MMRVHRIEISTWTSSFRYPNIISGYQPTLKVPPLSTILGLLNACAGKYIHYSDVELGYFFKYGATSVDLETIYQFSIDGNQVPKNDVKPNVVRREFLYDCKLYLYTANEELVHYLQHPHYDILLGRSNDMACIDSIEEIELEEIENASKIKGQIVPFVGNFLPGTLQALPKYFTDDIPRRNIGTEPFSIIPFDSIDAPTQIKAYRDNIDGEEIDIYMHHLNFD